MRFTERKDYDSGLLQLADVGRSGQLAGSRIAK